jgi:hypothetical protein
MPKKTGSKGCKKMSQRKQSQGTCLFCGKEMSKGGLSRHIKSCPQRQEANQAADDRRKGAPKLKLYHLQVRDAYIPDFWLHLEMKGTATLQDLDRYLRSIWLECCGHLSQFSVGGWRGDEISMGRNIGRVFDSGVELTHIYDFGTSSETLINAVDVRRGQPLSKNPIYLMARNKMPESICAECDREAGWYCVECLIEEDKWVTLCDEHVEKHPHNDYGEPLALANSPRVGMCGYDGPANPPY